jgi:hypothetical protein
MGYCVLQNAGRNPPQLLGDGPRKGDPAYGPEFIKDLGKQLMNVYDV